MAVRIPAPSNAGCTTARAGCPHHSRWDENALHRPSGDSLPCRENSTNLPGLALTVTPPASASEHSPGRSAWAARRRAVSTAITFLPVHLAADERLDGGVGVGVGVLLRR